MIPVSEIFPLVADGKPRASGDDPRLTKSTKDYAE